MESQREGTVQFPARGGKSPSLISRLLFLWLEPLLFKGYREELRHEDLYPIPSTMASQSLLKKFNRHWNQELERRKRGLKPRLLVALAKCVWWRLLLHGVVYGTEISLVFGQSVATGYLAEFFRDKQVLEEDLRSLRLQNDTFGVQAKQRDIDETVQNGYLYALSLVPLVFFYAVSRANTFFLAYKMGMMCRIITTGAIYEKVLRLSHTTIGKLSSGHIVNLASNDVQRFDLAFLFIHELWVLIVFFPIITYLLWREIGLACLTALSVPLLLLPIQYGFARLYSYFRSRSAKITDRRVRVMSEIVTGIRVIKMYAWEYAIKKYVQKIRKVESFAITKAAVIRIGNYAFFAFTTILLSFVSFSTFAGMGGEMTPRVVFTALGFYTYIRLYFILFMIISLFALSEASVAVKRIEKLLLLPELDRSGDKTENFLNKSSAVDTFNDTVPTSLQLTKHGSLDNIYDNEVGAKPAVYFNRRVVVDQLSASWSLNSDKLVLNKINFQVDQSCRLLVVVGTVGSGKSSLLHCLLGELEPLQGSVYIDGSESYASQEPWIFSGTIKENILFGLPFIESWYNRVVDACSLNKDIDDMPYGDDTLVGERGVTLSGGQKARVNLARAVYRDSDVYFLDDPLSAVDANVSRKLFENCITGLLRHKLVILVTHQLHYAKRANAVLVIREGTVQDYGTFDEVVRRGLDPSELLKNEEDKKENPEARFKSPPVFDRLMSTRSDRLTANTPTGEGYIQGSTVDLRDTSESDDKLSIHTAVSTQDVHKETMHNVVPEEDKAQGRISLLTYLKYYKEGGGILLSSLLILVYFMTEGNIVVGDWWLSEWARTGDSCSSNSTFDDKFCDYDLTARQRIAIFGGIVTSAIVLAFLRGYLYLFIVLQASRRLHNKMFAAILRTPVHFFDTNPVGRIINRFSKDIGFLDDVLPYESYQYTNLQLRVVSIFTVAAIANPWVVIPAIFTLISLILFRQYFVVASRKIKRLEALARSPLFSHISATLQGLTTIRSFRKGSSFLDQFHHYQNEHTKGWYLYVASSRLFGMRIDLFVAVYLTIVSFAAVPLASSLDPALVGLSLVYTVSLIGLFQYVVILSTEVEGLMVSTERVMSYGQLPPEGPLVTVPAEKKPPSYWPQKGVIHFDDLQFRYAKHLPYVLKSVTCDIKSCEKVGIVGRTGAGKSSLLSALFRIAEPDGVLEIDGIQITDLGLHDLRSKLSIIPQDPVLFSGTVRYNLDPFDEHHDNSLWTALDQVQLKKLIKGLDGCLDAEVLEAGSNFSVGERQLVCLARALLRKNKVLVIDEATANVDQNTDEIIQQTIREQFIDCTILTIAHRLNTIMDSDRVLVLQSGRIAEFDEPYLLLQNKSSYFSALVAQTGTKESEKLTEMARKHYLLNEKK